MGKSKNKHGKSFIVPTIGSKVKVTPILQGQQRVDIVTSVVLNHGEVEITQQPDLPSQCGAVKPKVPVYPPGINRHKLETVACYAHQPDNHEFLAEAMQPDKLGLTVAEDQMLQSGLGPLGGDLTDEEKMFCAGWADLARTFYKTEDELRAALKVLCEAIGPTG